MSRNETRLVFRAVGPADMVELIARHRMVEVPVDFDAVDEQSSTVLRWLKRMRTGHVTGVRLYVDGQHRRWVATRDCAGLVQVAFAEGVLRAMECEVVAGARYSEDAVRGQRRERYREWLLSGGGVP